jgi:heat shock protein HslJ
MGLATGARWAKVQIMRVRSVATMVMLLALPLAACASSNDTGSDGAASPPAQSLAGTAWDLAKYAPAGKSALTSVPDGVQATAEFTTDQISGSSGCNRFTGGYTTDGNTIDIGPLASTLMACVGAAMAVEADYLARLDEAATFSIGEGTMTMSDKAGQVVLSYTVAVPITLTGTNWSANGINTGTDAVSGLVAGSTVTAVFGDDGTISGNAGCNTYNGTYEVTGTTMKIGPLATTMMACEPDVSAQEANYLAALARVTKYTIRGDQLELRDDGGALQAGYVAG